MGDRGGRFPPPRKLQVDREKTCPFLVRAFVKIGMHHKDEEFALEKVPTVDEHQLYTWRDSTLRELILLIRDASPNLRMHPLGRYSIKLVYYDTPRSTYVSRELATLTVRDVVQRGSSNRSVEKTLDEARFVVGDFLDIAYFIPVPIAGVGAVPGGGPGVLAGPLRGGPMDRGGFGGGVGEKRAAEAWGQLSNSAPGGSGNWGRNRQQQQGAPFSAGQGREGGAGSSWAPRGSRGGAAPPADAGWNGPKFAPNAQHGGRDGPPHQRGGAGGDRRPARRSSRSRSPPRRRDSRASPPPPPPRRGSNYSADDMRD